VRVLVGGPGKGLEERQGLARGAHDAALEENDRSGANLHRWVIVASTGQCAGAVLERER